MVDIKGWNQSARPTQKAFLTHNTSLVEWGLNNTINQFDHSYMNIFYITVGVPIDIDIGLKDFAAGTEWVGKSLAGNGTALTEAEGKWNGLVWCEILIVFF